MRVISILKKNIERLLKTRGVIGGIRFVVSSAFDTISKSRRQTLSPREAKGLEFDRKYGVNTSGKIQLAELDIESENWIYGVRYRPIFCVEFGPVFEELNLSYEKFIFVDLGSGKGRTLLLASAFPFKKIIGVEFSQELTSIAKENLISYPKELMKCKDIELICMDAVEYNLPEEPVVLYFYDPFHQPVMARVLDNITTSFRNKSRRIVILYYGPRYHDLLDNIGFLKKLKSTKGLCVYDTQND